MKITNLPSGMLSANTYLAVDEDTNEGFIVDPGGYNPKLTEMVETSGYKIKYIILTHGHGDHIGGVKGHLEDFPDAKLVASEKESELLADPQMNMSTMTCREPVSLAADIKIKDGQVLQVGNMKLEFMSTPGHSPGGMCIKVGNCLFSGDTLFCQSIGRTDFPGCSFEELADSIHEKLFVLPDETKVFPGHMGPTEIGYEKENNPFI